MKHYRYRKINLIDIEVMKILKEAKVTHKEIARGFKIATSCVQYHLVPKQRENSIKRAMKSYKGLSKEKKLKKSRKQAKYRSQYYPERYNNDEEFRRRHIQNIGNSHKRLKKGWIKKGLCSNCGKERGNKMWAQCEKCRGKKRLPKKLLLKNEER